MHTVRFPLVLRLLIGWGLAALLLMLASGCPDHSQNIGFGQVAGRINLTGGIQPAAGAAVRVRGTNLQTTTDGQGSFLLSGVPAGSQTLTVSLSGYQSKAIPVVVMASSLVTLPAVELAAASRIWTVLVYMNADNDLEQFGIQDMNEMEAVPENGEVTVLVQMDRIGGFDNTNGGWNGTRRYRIQHDTDTAIITSPLLEDMGEVDMGDPRTLREFIAWGQALAPAEHYLLVVWNHGAGWRTRAIDDPTRGVSFDDTSGTFINTIELPGALTAGMPIDLVAFDASLMQMLEVAYEIRNACEFVVGSEESPPGEGYPYDRCLGPLMADPTLSPQELAVTFARETLAFYGTNSNITHSVLATAELPALAGAVDAFAQQLIPLASSQAANLAAARDGAEGFKASTFYYRDLYDYTEQVKSTVANADLLTAAANLQSAITSAVVANYHGAQHPRAHGVSIYLPLPTVYSRTIGLYQPLDLSQQTHWDEWLGEQRQ